MIIIFKSVNRGKLAKMRAEYLKTAKKFVKDNGITELNRIDLVNEYATANLSIAFSSVENFIEVVKKELKVKIN